MPKSKRNRVVSLTKTEKKGKELNAKTYSQVQECLDQYTYVWVFSVENMRNTHLKEVRSEFSDSRFVLMAFFFSPSSSFPPLFAFSFSFSFSLLLDYEARKGFISEWIL